MKSLILLAALTVPCYAVVEVVPVEVVPVEVAPVEPAVTPTEEPTAKPVIVPSGTHSASHKKDEKKIPPNMIDHRNSLILFGIIAVIAVVLLTTL